VVRPMRKLHFAKYVYSSLSKNMHEFSSVSRYCSHYSEFKHGSVIYFCLITIVSWKWFVTLRYQPSKGTLTGLALLNIRAWWIGPGRSTDSLQGRSTEIFWKNENQILKICLQSKQAHLRPHHELRPHTPVDHPRKHVNHTRDPCLSSKALS